MNNPYESPEHDANQGANEDHDGFGLWSFWILLAQPLVLVVLLTVTPVYHGPAPPPNRFLISQLVGLGCLLEFVLALLVIFCFGMISVSRWRQRRRFRLLGLVSLTAASIILSLIAANWLFPEKF